jgi:hypothetical protein
MDICDIHRKFSLTRYIHHTRVQKKFNRSGLKFIKYQRLGWLQPWTQTRPGYIYEHLYPVLCLVENPN